MDMFHGHHYYIRSRLVFDVQFQFTSKPVNARSGTYLDWYSHTIKSSVDKSFLSVLKVVWINIGFIYKVSHYILHEYFVTKFAIQKPCWDECWRCSCNGTRCFVNAWSGTYLDWHKHHCPLTYQTDIQEWHTVLMIMVTPDRESQMYSHYIMLCEHSWWYLSLGSSSQLN